MATCNWCEGTGFISQGTGSETCPECLGTGEVDDGGDGADDSGDRYVPSAASPGGAASAKARAGGAFTGFGCGCLVGLVSIVTGMGLATIPVVGWVLATGFIGAGLLWPFLGGWIGSRS